MKLQPGKYIKPELRKLIMDDIGRHISRTRLPLLKILKMYNIARATYYSWFDQSGEVRIIRKKRRRSISAVLPEEIEAVKKFRLKHQEVGYRKLTWMMIDAGDAFLSESCIYRLLKASGMLKMGGVHTYASDEYKDKPLYVHHH